MDSTNKPATPLADSRQEAQDSEYLHALGEHIRDLRVRRGMTRAILARDSGVSVRYLAQLESGDGNISILRLRQVAQAMAIEEQVRAYGGPRFQLTQQVMNRFAEAIQVSKVDVVPRVVVGGGGAEGGGGASGNVMEALLTMLLSEKMGNDLVGAAAGARSAETEAMRKKIRDGMSEPDGSNS